MFKVFSWQHFIYLFMSIGIIVALVLVFRKSSKKTKKILEITLVSVIGATALFEYIGKLISMPDKTFWENLPLNLYDVFAVIMLLVFFRRSVMWSKFAYYIIAPISVYSLIFMPNFYNGIPAFSLVILSYIFLNTALISYSLLNLFWTDIYLEKKDILICTVNLLIILAFANVWNVICRFGAFGLEANYCGTIGENFDIVLGWLGSIIKLPLVNMLPLIAILVGIEVLLILPFDLIKLRKQEKEKLDEMVALGNMKAQQEYRRKRTRTDSQILLYGEKAKPAKEKDIYNASGKDGFVNVSKEVKTNKEIKDSDNK